MGTGKKEAARKERQGKTGDGMGNVRTKGENFYRYVHHANLVAFWENLGTECLYLALRRR